MVRKCERLVLHCTYGNLLYNILNEGIIPKTETFDINPVACSSFNRANDVIKYIDEASSLSRNAARMERT